MIGRAQLGRPLFASERRNSNFTNAKLKVVCSVLDLEKKGTHSDLVDRILTFLVAPKNSGKVSGERLALICRFKQTAFIFAAATEDVCLLKN